MADDTPETARFLAFFNADPRSRLMVVALSSSIAHFLTQALGHGPSPMSRGYVENTLDLIECPDPQIRHRFTSLAGMGKFEMLEPGIDALYGHNERLAEAAAGSITEQIMDLASASPEGFSDDIKNKLLRFIAEQPLIHNGTKLAETHLEAIATLVHDVTDYALADPACATPEYWQEIIEAAGIEGEGYDSYTPADRHIDLTIMMTSRLSEFLSIMICNKAPQNPPSKPEEPHL